MASRRPGPHAFGWSGDASSRNQDTTSEGGKFNSRWNLRKGAEASHQPVRAIPHPTLASRLPQSLSQRRPSDGQPEQARLGQPARFRTSVGSANSLAVGEGSGPSSSIPVSSRLAGPNLKPRNVLRRKRSGLSQDTGSSRNDSRNDSTGASSSDSNARSQTPLEPQLDRELTQSPMEIRVAQQIEIPKTMAQAVTIYPELDRYRDVKRPPRDESPGFSVPYRIATQDLPPPTPLFSGTSSQISAFSGSPSTRWSGSPGPGPYSRDTTPTSISSASPGLVAPLRIPPSAARIRQADSALARPPVTRRRTGSISNEVVSLSADPQGLASVKELSTSASSNSTVRADGNAKEKKSKRPPPTPPSPPPRKSSHKPKPSRDEGVPSSEPFPEAAHQQGGVSPSPAKAASHSRPRPAQAAQPATSPKPAPPIRPSRIGTVDLQSQPMPVIHSNLSATSLSERRQSSVLAPGLANRSLISSSLPDRSSRLLGRPHIRESNPAPSSANPGETIGASKQQSGRTTRTPSPSVSTFKSRFPLFGRRTKIIPEPGQQEKSDKPARKGPAAGTGHEGYGRLGSVRRRSSSVANPARVIPGTMSSQESLSSSQSYDPFLMERMAPVIIAGGEVVENRNTSSELTRTESNQSSTFRRPSTESRNSSQVSLSSRDAPRNTLWPSPLPRGVTQTPSLSSRRPSESSDHEVLMMKPTLALRRSMQRLQSGEQDPPRLPTPIVTRPQVVSPSTTSLDASIKSDDSISDPSADLAAASKEQTGTAGLFGSRKLIKRARSPRKWNLFGRSLSQPAAGKEETAKTVAATVKAVQSRPVAFYTMMDSSEQDDADAIDLEEVLREARGVTATPGQGQHPMETAQSKESSAKRDLAAAEPSGFRQGDQQRPPNPARTVTATDRLHSSRVVSSQAAAAPALASQPGNPSCQTPARPSRLPQVGRIPKVVSARAEQVSPKSFSRPFHRLSAQVAPVGPAIQDANSVAKGPSPPKPSTPEPAFEEAPARYDSNISALIYGVPRLSPPLPSQEFLTFSPRKNSQCTTTTSSSSSGGLLTYADATAVVPEPNAPLAEDEIWDEYNDLLGEDTLQPSSEEAPSWPKPLRLESSAQGNGKLIEPAMESPTLSPPPLPSLVAALRSGMEQLSSSVCGSEIAEEVKRMLDNPPLETAAQIQDPRSGQTQQVPSHDAVKQAGEPDSAAQDSAASPTPPTRRSDASGSSQGSEDSSPLSQVNLRVGSMTVSKWLTFGHVLFSPVRDELVSDVGSLKRPSILVIDGLGNDDWSFYAAETYPAATFFNLSPRAPIPAERRHSPSFPLTPPNHHQIQYLSHTDKFPFGAQSFTAVVIRFPAAAPESHYRNIISEARRVLKPGGFIELSILDVDMNNMGNRGRRTVRRLKERIHAKSPDVSLAPASDLILRLIGRRGFTDIKSCRVGVPVASIIARSSGSDEAGTNGKRNSTGGGSAGQSKPKKDERSLPEMISDEGPVADENITKSVAKVGRWWYTRCYESAAGPGAGPGPRTSMWKDKALLAECEEWGTSLKLMVCHARAPDGRARVASI